MQNFRPRLYYIPDSENLPSPLTILNGIALTLKVIVIIFIILYWVSKAGEEGSETGLS